MANGQLGIGLVGSGMISEFQAQAIGDLDNAVVTGFYDMVPELAAKRAEQFGRKAYSSMEELLADEGVDIVSICTPSGSHLEPSLAAAAAAARGPGHPAARAAPTEKGKRSAKGTHPMAKRFNSEVNTRKQCSPHC